MYLTNAKRYSRPARAILLALIAGGLALAGHSRVEAQNLKIGYIDDEKVLESYEAWKRADGQFQTEV
ncbi:MAG: hypothetical protein ACE5GA_04850, partial [Candidatus Zixiibacteriota bacterium]